MQAIVALIKLSDTGPIARDLAAGLLSLISRGQIWKVNAPGHPAAEALDRLSPASDGACISAGVDCP